ncbi:hypothetical protein Ahia01_000560200 [Argonauta hians]
MDVFYSSQWRWPGYLFVLYRMGLCLFSATSLIDYLIMMCEESTLQHNVFTYITTWTYITLVLYLFLAAVMAAYFYWRIQIRKLSASWSPSSKFTSLSTLMATSCPNVHLTSSAFFLASSTTPKRTRDVDTLKPKRNDQEIVMKLQSQNSHPSPPPRPPSIPLSPPPPRYHHHNPHNQNNQDEHDRHQEIKHNPLPHPRPHYPHRFLHSHKNFNENQRYPTLPQRFHHSRYKQERRHQHLRVPPLIPPPPPPPPLLPPPSASPIPPSSPPPPSYLPPATRTRSTSSLTTSSQSSLSFRSHSESSTPPSHQLSTLPFSNGGEGRDVEGYINNRRQSMPAVTTDHVDWRANSMTNLNTGDNRGDNIGNWNKKMPENKMSEKRNEESVPLFTSAITTYSPSTPRCYFQVCWLLYETLFVLAILMGSIYLLELLPLLKHQTNYDSVSYVDIGVNCANCLLVFSEVFICAYPVRLLHVIYPIIYAACYVVFSLAYWSIDTETNIIYDSILNWNNPGFTAVQIVLLIFVIIPLLNIIHFALYQLRLFIYKQIYMEDYLFIL